MKISRFLTYYFSLSYFFSWIVFILLALNRHGKIFLFSDDAAHARLADFFHAFGALGPAIAAIVILTLFCNKEQRQFYYSSFSPIGLSFTAWFVSLSPVLYLFLAILISKVITGEWFSIAAFFKQNNLLEPVNFFMWLFPSITYGIFEEMGWRGFALPLLQKMYSSFISSTIITVFLIVCHVTSLWYS